MARHGGIKTFTQFFPAHGFNRGQFGSQLLLPAVGDPLGRLIHNAKALRCFAAALFCAIKHRFLYPIGITSLRSVIPWGGTHNAKALRCFAAALFCAIKHRFLYPIGITSLRSVIPWGSTHNAKALRCFAAAPFCAIKHRFLYPIGITSLRSVIPWGG
jgi:hypothetical protein